MSSLVLLLAAMLITAYFVLAICLFIRNMFGVFFNRIVECQVDRIVPGSLPSSETGPVILVVSKADGDEEVSYVSHAL